MGAKRAFFAVFCPQGEECDKLLLSTPYLHRQGAKELNDAMLTPIIHDKCKDYIDNAAHTLR